MQPKGFVISQDLVPGTGGTSYKFPPREMHLYVPVASIQCIRLQYLSQD